jgi:DNA polymerase-3 subunit beta
MKIVCSKENLSDGINIVQKAVSTKTPMPILEGILFEAKDNNLKLVGNDLQIGIECFVEADILEEGSIVINSRIIGDIIRRLPDSEVLIEVKENNEVFIECENSHFSIKGLEADGFPDLPFVNRENEFKLKQSLLKEMVRQTIFAVSLDENRPILTGTLIECKDGQLTFVSIDGFRMALRREEVDNLESELNVVVPGKTLNDIIKIIQSEDEDISIYSSKGIVLFDMGNCRLVSRLLEGEYLNYDSIIPDENTTRVRINTRDLLGAIERAALVIPSDERRYPISIEVKDDVMIISSNTEIGAVKEEINIDLEGKEIDIGFNPRYFIDALKVIDNENIDVYFTSSIGPCTIRPVEGNSFIYMILPVRR